MARWQRGSAGCVVFFLFAGERETPAVRATERTLATICSGLLAMRWLRRYDYGQTFASFVATSLENGATRGGTHPGEKSVSSFATKIAWLICSFHYGPSVQILCIFLR